MVYEDIVVLIPSHGLEDLPTDLGDDAAASLLNSFAVAWHPALLASAGMMPNWRRADDPPEVLANRLIFVPGACEGWLQHGWIEKAQSEGAIVVSGLNRRDEMVAVAVDPLELQTPVDPNLAADFLALGTCYLQVELLTRHMHHFSNIDEMHLQREAVSAAEAAIAGDEEAAKAHLRVCFEVLTEARERFYPVDCYLIDLCLLVPDMADSHFAKMLSDGEPANYLVTAADVEEIANTDSDVMERFRAACAAGTADVVGSDHTEGPSPLIPLESLLWELSRGRTSYRKHLGRAPATWGRRRFGLSTLLPQILSRWGYRSAMHVLLDDGLYPDTEHSKIRWEGSDGSIIDAMTRIPLAGDSPPSYLRFAERMAESMESDQVAAIIFARWPEVQYHWFDDLRRTQKYSPCLGRFVTLSDFFERTEDPGRLSHFDAGEYLSPFLVQAVARQQQDPISRYAGHFLRRCDFDSALSYRAVAGILNGRETFLDEEPDNERLLESGGPETDHEAVDTAESMLDEFVPSSAGELAEAIMQGAGGEPGVLILNSLSFPRRVSVELPGVGSAPDVSGVVKSTQFDAQHRSATVDLPSFGFAWIPTPDQTQPQSPASRTKKDNVPIAEDGVLRNELFEVHINQATGGISSIKGHGRSPNRLSQQLAFRFPNERTIRVGKGEESYKEKSFYTEMRCVTSDVACSGPSLGEIVTTGDIVDQKKEVRLAGFRQTIRVWRGCPIVELDVELDVAEMPDGDPWTNYFASRFAWNDDEASLTRSVLGAAMPFTGERFESPHYLEIAASEHRTTILNMGIPFHRKTGPRMIDTLLVAAGESQRHFRFVIAVDTKYPMQAALDAMTPPAVVPTQTGPPAFGRSGWFFHLNVRNVILTRIMGAVPEEVRSAPSESSTERREPDAAAPLIRQFTVRLVETEGRHREVKLRCFKTPHSARRRDATGRILGELSVEDDCVVIDMTAYEMADVELLFDE